jgi:SHS2 domain-containing protein
MTPPFEQLEHTADLALRVSAASLGELFATAALAMFSQLADLKLITPSVQLQVALEAPDAESLLVDWLNELLYLHDTRGEVYTSFTFEELSQHKLRASVSGDKAVQVYTIIKAATYHGLSIRETQEGFVATIVFDV